MIPYAREAIGAAAAVPFAVVITVLFYEGAPLGPLRWIPVVGPVLEGFTDGRVDRVRKEGAAGERILWEEARRKLQAQLAEERRKAQATINAAEADYLASQTNAALTIVALEEALAKETADAANPSCPARPAVPGGLSDSLNKIGR